MEISLSYYPIIHTAPINKCGLALMKPGGHNTQKFAFIGSDGLIKCYRFDKNALSQRFIGESNSGHAECVITDNDNLVVSQNQSLIFYNRKGETIETRNIPLDNNVTAILSHGGKIHVATGEYCNTLGVQESTIMFDAPIVGFASVGNVTYTAITTGAVYSFVPGAQQLLHNLPGNCTMIGSVQRTAKEAFLAVGCSDNKLRFYDSLDKEVSSVELPSPPCCISEFDIDKDGFPELFVALENGNVCLVSLSIIETPKVLSSITVGFAATNIAAGYIYSGNLVSALITSQSGHVGIVSAEPRKDRSLLTSIAPKVTQQELNDLRTEVAALEKTMKTASKTITAIPVHTLIELRPDPATESFCLIVESERPISRIAMSATLPITIKSRSDCQTMIFQAKRKPPVSSGVVNPVDNSATRVSVDIIYQTGTGGELQVFVNYWNSTAVYNQEFQLKPFGLLKKLQTNPLQEVKDEALSSIEISTSGTSAIFHDIINNCLPNALDEGVPMSFSSGCIAAPVTVMLTGDRFTAKSVFFPIVVQLRSYILSSMNNAKQKVTFDTRLGPQCIKEFFRQISERFFAVNKIAANHMTLTALQEVRNSTAMTNFGLDNDEMTRIMQEADEIERNYEACENEYKSYVSMIEQFYIDMWKNSNINATKNLDELRSILKETLDEESLSVLINFMSAQPQNV